MFSPVDTSASCDVEIPDAKAVSLYSHPAFHTIQIVITNVIFLSKVVVLEESALSAVEAAADAVIGERYFGDHLDDNGDDDDDIGGHDKR